MTISICRIFDGSVSVRTSKGDLTSPSHISTAFYPPIDADMPLPRLLARCAPDDPRPDLIMLTSAEGLDAAREHLGPAVIGIAPIADASGGHFSFADWSAGTDYDLSLSLAPLGQMIARWRKMPNGIERLREVRLILLSRLVTRECALMPVRKVNHERLWYWSESDLLPHVSAAAIALARTGYLVKRFVDRVHDCTSCASSRIVVREECKGCRSANIKDVPILHHMRCGYQAPETDFLSTGELPRCPKCRMQLEHFSVDYDKPGHLTVCGACGRTDGSAAIGFSCLDCGTHHDASRITTRDVHAFELTDEGRMAALKGSFGANCKPDAGEASLRDKITRFIKEAEIRHRPAHLLMLRVDPVPGHELPGPGLMASTLAHLNGLLREILADRTEITLHERTFLILIAGHGEDTIRAALPTITEELARSTAARLQLQFDLIAQPELLSVAA
jgi:hypothetical protein